MKLHPGLASLALSCLFAFPAIAGDVAELNILGFSEDGKLFAFEEFGVQDGSGFPYANRYYIDVETDKFVPGSPIRVRLDEEAATVEQARTQAREKGETIIAEAELAANRGTLVGFNPPTELSADPHRITVNPRPVFPPIGLPLEFRIEEIAVPQPDLCRELAEAKGYRLTRVSLTPGQETTLLHQDVTIPTSRGCPLGYQFGGVQTFFPESGPPVYAVLIAVRSFGFEGPDFRWIAVPGRF